MMVSLTNNCPAVSSNPAIMLKNRQSFIDIDSDIDLEIDVDVNIDM